MTCSFPPNHIPLARIWPRLTPASQLAPRANSSSWQLGLVFLRPCFRLPCRKQKTKCRGPKMEYHKILKDGADLGVGGLSLQGTQENRTLGGWAGFPSLHPPPSRCLESLINSFKPPPAKRLVCSHSQQGKPGRGRSDRPAALKGKFREGK